MITVNDLVEISDTELVFQEDGALQSISFADTSERDAFLQALVLANEGGE